MTPIYRKPFKIKKISFLIIFMLMGIFQQACAEEGQEIESVTVMADSNLAIPLSQLASEFSAHNMTSIANVFGMSDDQEKKIENGESADLFITRDPAAIEQLKVKGMVDVYSISKLGALNGIFFTAAVVASENMTPARHFLEYLKSDDAKKIFEQNEVKIP
jgi:ABC-type molybdate transport system substrate-binding protein